MRLSRYVGPSFRSGAPSFSSGFTIVLFALAIVLTGAGRAQVPIANLDVSPVYEGWLPNDDGSFNLVFGYLNRAWDETFTVPLGTGNSIDPGGPDQGQPTYFFPRRNRFVFQIRVPKDFGSKELVWTLTTKGKTQKAYGTLRPDYVLDDTVIMSNIGAGGALSTSPDMVGNKAPVLALSSPKSVTAKVGTPVALAATATDDGKPNKRNMPALTPGNYTLPQSANGLRLSFFVYRGPGDTVTFEPRQTEVWEHTRDGGNSPWSSGWQNPPIPAGNKWTATATFRQPGTYVIRALAHDGGLFSYEDITVTVTR